MKIRDRMPLLRRVVRRLGARLFHWAENNGDSATCRNGEQWFLKEMIGAWGKQSLSPSGTRVIFDVGANVGDYSALVLSAADRIGLSIQIHAFEPGAATLEALLKRYSKEPRINVVGNAVGQQPGELRLYSSAPCSTHASLFNRSQDQEEQCEMVEVVRLDDYLHKAGVKHVDFLKLDVEGAELLALKGLGALLRPETVRVIQLEYGGTTLDAGNRLRDYFDLLEERGYVVAKLLPRALEIRKYAPWMDQYFYANFVAFGPGEFSPRP